MANKIILTGNVGKKPETKVFESDTKKAWFTFATTDGKDATTWHNVSAFGKLADIVEKYIDKGSKLYIEGKMQYRNYEKDGVKHSYAEVVADKIEFLNSKPNSETKQEEEVREYEETDDLPF